MSDVLIELPGGEGVVRRGDGEIMVTGDVRCEGGQRVREGNRFGPVKVWLPNDRSLVGGLLAPGAVGVEVVDDTGARVAAVVRAGAYAAVLEQPIDGQEPVVCCRDRAGSPVRRPLAGEYPGSLVVDADEPCPACGAIDYEECRPTEQWRGGSPGHGGTTIPSPIVVCRRCGHEEPEGTIMRLVSPGDEDEEVRAARIARARAERRVHGWYRNKITLLAVMFPIYAAEGWPAQINGSGSHGDELTELTIAHTDNEDTELSEESPRIEVTTSTEPLHESELVLARRRLEQWVDIHHPHVPGLSDAAVTLWFSAMGRRRRAAALTAARSDAQIRIDGAPHPFTVLTGPGERWVAVRRHDDLTVTIAARDLDPASINLEPIADPAARLLGPEPEEP